MSNNSKKIERLVLSIATNQFKGPLPTGKEIVTAVNERDQLLAEVARLKSWIRNILDSGVEFEDPRISYKTMQIEKADLEAGRALIKE